MGERIFQIVVVVVFALALVFAFRITLTSVGYSDTNLDRSIRVAGPNGGYLVGGAPK